MRKNILKFALFLTALTPAIILGYLILENSVNIPYMDDWDTPGVILTINSDRVLSLADWFAQHNESRPAFPRLIFSLLANLTGWDLRYQMLLSFLFAGLISLNIFYISKKTIKENTIKLLWLNTLANFLIFSPVTDNWLWGIQALVFIPMLCITTYAAICYSNIKDEFKLFIGIILASISTFSYSSGILMWIVAIPFLLVSNTFNFKTIRKKRLFIGIWISGFLLNTIIYFYDYHKPEYHPSFLDALTQPIQALQFFFAFLGAPLSFSNLFTNRLILSQIIGIILIVLFIFACFYGLKHHKDKDLIERLTPGLVIACYTIFCALIAAAGRVGGGIQVALAPRYITFSVYLGVALIYLLAIIFNHIKSLNHQRTLTVKPIAYSLTLVFVYFSMNSLLFGIQSMPKIKQQRLHGKACLMLIDVFVDQQCLQNKIYPLNFDLLQDRAKLLSNLGFLTPQLVDDSLFKPSEEAQTQPTNINGFIDNFKPVNPENSMMIGWAVIPEKNKPADLVILTYQYPNHSIIPFTTAEVNGLRPDVVDAFNQPNYLQSGWGIQFPSDQIPPEATQVTAWGFDRETGKAYQIQTIAINSNLEDSPQSILSNKTTNLNDKKTLKDLGYLKMSLGYNHFGGLINQVNDSTEYEQSFSQDTPIQVTGWSVLPKHNQLPDQVILTLGSNYTIVAQTTVNMERPDIATLFENPQLIKAGWSVQLDPTILTNEPTTLRAWAYDSKHQIVYRLKNTFKLKKK
ncbi:MAG: hypothetical protein WBA77_13405 [Microcoleaceae cyanobacterium]